MEIDERVRLVIVDQFGVENSTVKAETRIVADLRADSLDSLELVMALEDEFSIEIYDEDAEKCETVGDAIQLVQALAGRQ